MPTNWNYRITKELIDEWVYYFSVREVYYDKSGKPESWSSEAIRIDAYHTEEEFRENFELISQAMKRPILEIKDNKII